MAPTKVLKNQILKETRAPVQPSLTSVAEVERIRAILDDAKAHDVTVIPLAGQASFADYLVIATGTSTRHVSSMGRALQEKVGKQHIFGLEGLEDGEWVCADLGGIVVHIFVPEKRALYNLEKLWSHVFTPAPDYDEADKA